MAKTKPRHRSDTARYSRITTRCKQLDLRFREVFSLPEYQQPQEGMMALDEFPFPTAEEMESYYNLFWSPKHWKYGPDYYRIPRTGITRKSEVGNVTTLGIWFWNPVDALGVFLQQSIASPFSCDLSRQQWAIVLPGLIRREALWNWLPSIIKAHDNDSNWNRYRCSGWSCYRHNFPVVHDDDIFIGPAGVITRKQYNELKPKWKGISMFRDIIMPL